MDQYWMAIVSFVSFVFFSFFGEVGKPKGNEFGVEEEDEKGEREGGDDLEQSTAEGRRLVGKVRFVSRGKWGSENFWKVFLLGLNGGTWCKLLNRGPALCKMARPTKIKQVSAQTLGLHLLV